MRATLKLNAQGAASVGLSPLLCGRRCAAGSRGYSLCGQQGVLPLCPLAGGAYPLLAATAISGPPREQRVRPAVGYGAGQMHLHPGCAQGRLGASRRVLPSSRVRGTGLRGPVSAPGIWSGHSRALSGRRGRIAGATVGGTSAMTPPICAFDGSAGRRRWRRGALMNLHGASGPPYPLLSAGLLGAVDSHQRVPRVGSTKLP